MCICLSRSDDGQLALMDAMVFFCMSALVCSILVSSAFSSICSDASGSDNARCDPARVLSTLLRSTFDGSSLQDPDAVKLLRGTEDVAQVLMVLGLVAAEGPLPAQLTCMAGEVLYAVSSICHPSVDPHLSLVLIEDGSLTTVLIIEEAPAPEDEELRAASQEISGPGEEEMLAVLILSPSSRPHLDGV